MQQIAYRFQICFYGSKSAGGLKWEEEEEDGKEGIVQWEKS
jgi:hypothetical protein